MSGVLVVGMVMGMCTVAQMPLPFPCLLLSGVPVVGMVMGMSTVAQMPLPFPCLLLPSGNGDGHEHGCSDALTIAFPSTSEYDLLNLAILGYSCAVFCITPKYRTGCSACHFSPRTAKTTVNRLVLWV